MACYRHCHVGSCRIVPFYMYGEIAHIHIIVNYGLLMQHDTCIACLAERGGLPEQAAIVHSS
jgi:hypothetical protein